jgi:hypothetical protein
MKPIINLWCRGQILRQAFQEHKACMRNVYSIAAEVVQCSVDTPSEYRVALGEIPREFYSLRRNLFSLLFMSAYHLLDISAERRALYGRLNHLFRVWVTSADNLLDDESKTVLPLQIPGQSKVMREVVSVMAADRVMGAVLSDAVSAGVITEAESRILAFGSLQVLLPSAAQEASEENGVRVRPDPDVVLTKIHRYKTGMLFHIPLLGPERIEPSISSERLDRMKESLMAFGLGCQLLDDVRDMGRDLREQRHNYALSLLARDYPDRYASCLNKQPGDRMYHHCAEVSGPTAKLGLRHMREGLVGLGALGLGFDSNGADALASSMFDVLDLGDLEYA